MENTAVKEGAQRTGLRSDALGLPSVLMQAIAHTAPATAILLTIQFTVAQTGVVGPLAYLLAFFLVLTLGLGVIQLARHLPSAGGYYTYVSRTVHPRAGFLTAWLFFLYSALTPAFSLAMMGSVLENSLKSQYGVVFPWWLFLLMGTAFTAFVTYRGVEVSAAALVILGILEVGCVVLLATWGFFSPGPGGVNFSSFKLANAPNGNGLYLAIVFSIFALTGWEGAAPLAEETKDPKRIVPRAILGAILFMGVYLIFTSWGDSGRLGYEPSSGFYRMPGSSSVCSGPKILGSRLDPGAFCLDQLNGSRCCSDNFGIDANVVRHGAFRLLASTVRGTSCQIQDSAQCHFLSDPGYGGIRHWNGTMDRA